VARFAVATRAIAAIIAGIMRKFALRSCFAAALWLATQPTLPAAQKRALLIAGPPSHGPLQHEHNAGVLLLQKCLAAVPDLHVDVALNGWPPDGAAALAQADAVLIYADGSEHHIALADDHPAQLERLAARGGGIGCLHYAVEPTIEKGEKEFLRWIGGCFEINWSVNPVWAAEFKMLPSHPITRGVRPFTLRDEWYFNLRFADDRKSVTPLLVAKPTAETIKRRDGPHENNPAVRAIVARGEPVVMAWACQRADGGRGFGFTGAHYHLNWANDDFRKLVLNAIVWLAKLDVPPGGIASTVTEADLQANLDPKPPK